MKPFQPGIDVLLSRHRDWLSGRRVALVSHTAAVDSRGCLTARRLAEARDFRLACLMGPEHGFHGTAGAGAACGHARHPHWKVPVFSLYGETRKPTAPMLKGVEVIVFDLQDLGARPYTYVSTLRLVLETAAERDCPVIVADRPVPLPRVTDGPRLDPRFSSFVSLVDTPVSYGMTPGETALWLKEQLRLPLDLRVAPMTGYRRPPARGPDWPPWLPPSPAIVSWESATCFPVTVFFEGLGAVDHGRQTGIPFQIVGAAWMNAPETAECLSSLRLPGVDFHPHRYDSRPRDSTPAILDGVRLVVTDRNRFKPVFTAVSIICALQHLYGKQKVWNRKTTRPDFFDKLFGTDTVRKALLDGESAAAIARAWRPDLARFRQTRRRHLLYPDSP